MARGPERASGQERGGMLSRRAFAGLVVKGAIGVGVASWLVYLQNRRSGTENVRAPGRIPPNPFSSIERVPAEEATDAARLFREQIRTNQEPTFAGREARRTDTYWLNRYATTARASFQQAQTRLDAPAYPNDESRKGSYRDLLTAAFLSEGVPAELLQIGFVETSFQFRDAEGNLLLNRSPAEAYGPFQFTEAAAIRFKVGIAKNPDGQVNANDERLDPLKAAAGCARYLHYFATRSQRKGASYEDSWLLAAFAYNGGYAQTYIESRGTKSVAGFFEFLQTSMRSAFERSRARQEIRAVPGDSAVRIATRHMVNVSALRRLDANANINWGRLKVGDKVTIPTFEESGPRHVLRAGETPTSIFQRYGVTEAQFKAANPDVTETDWTKLPLRTILVVPPEAAVYQRDLQERRFNLVRRRGYIENIDYGSKLKAAVLASKS